MALVHTTAHSMHWMYYMLPVCIIFFFCIIAELLVDKAIELRFVGGVYGGNIQPTPFLCLILKMLQIQPEKDIIIEFIKNEEFKYVLWCDTHVLCINDNWEYCSILNVAECMQCTIIIRNETNFITKEFSLNSLLIITVLTLCPFLCHIISHIYVAIKDECI